MNVSQMFRAVSEGRVVTLNGYAWSCPECGAILGQSACREARDRRALAHCLRHGAVALRPADGHDEALPVRNPRRSQQMRYSLPGLPETSGQQLSNRH